MFKNKYVIKGDVTEITLKRRKYDDMICLVDTEDLQKIIDLDATWCITSNRPDTYYVFANIRIDENGIKNKKTAISMQTFIMDTRTGTQKIKIIVDHINHDTMDNRKSNLRIIDNDQNTKNRSGKNSNNKSGYRNVCWNNKDNCWMVQLQVEGKNTRLKNFPENQVNEAGVYAEKMRKEIYGEFAGKN